MCSQCCLEQGGFVTAEIYSIGIFLFTDIETVTCVLLIWSRRISLRIYDIRITIKSNLEKISFLHLLSMCATYESTIEEP